MSKQIVRVMIRVVVACSVPHVYISFPSLTQYVAGTSEYPDMLSIYADGLLLMNGPYKKFSRFWPMPLECLYAIY